MEERLTAVDIYNQLVRIIKEAPDAQREQVELDILGYLTDAARKRNRYEGRTAYAQEIKELVDEAVMIDEQAWEEEQEEEDFLLDEEEPEFEATAVGFLYDFITAVHKKNQKKRQKAKNLAKAAEGLAVVERGREGLGQGLKDPASIIGSFLTGQRGTLDQQMKTLKAEAGKGGRRRKTKKAKKRRTTRRR